MMSSSAQKKAWALLSFALFAVLYGATLAAADVDPPPASGNGTTPGHHLSNAHMTWKSWYVLFAICVMLVVLISGVADSMCVMIAVSSSCYLLGIITTKELFNGMANEGVLSILMLFVIVTPMSELPLIKSLIRLCFRSVKAGGSMRWALFNICFSSMLFSSLLENIPQVSMMTSVIRDICDDLKLAPSQLLLPMDYSVLIGNYAIIGATNNLVISGLMVKFGMPEMKFFELAKVNGPMSIVCLIYLVFFPHFLLPRNKGGLLKMHKVEKAIHNITVKVLPESNLIGTRANEVGGHFPGDNGQASCRFVNMLRGGEPTTPETVIQSGDVLTVYGGAEVILASLEILGLKCLDSLQRPCDFSGSRVDASGSPLLKSDASFRVSITASPTEMKTVKGNDDGKTSTATKNAAEAPDSSKLLKDAERHQTKPEGDATDDNAESTSTSTQSTADGAEGGDGAQQKGAGKPTEAINVESAEQLKNASLTLIDLNQSAAFHRVPDRSLFEVILSADSPWLGRLATDNEIALGYTASILGVKVHGKPFDRADAEHRPMEAGNTVLLLAPSYFQEEHGNEFALVSKLNDMRQKILHSQFFRFPRWSPIGRFVCVDRNHKYVRVPTWWPYWSVVAFFGIVIGALLGIPLAGCCIIAVCFVVAMGVVSAKEALHYIDWHVFVFVAFSFGIGMSVDRSGLAAVVGKLVTQANVTGLPLLLLISFLTIILANVVNNKTAAQVMFPVVFAIYKAQDLDPLPGVMVMASTSVVALATPFGYASNMMVMEPGGYTPTDFLRFGVPLSIIIAILVPLTAWFVY